MIQESIIFPPKGHTTRAESCYSHGPIPPDLTLKTSTVRQMLRTNQLRPRSGGFGGPLITYIHMEYLVRRVSYL